MNDREERAALEAAQTELREARAQWAVLPDRAEVSRRLEALGKEGVALGAELRGQEGLRAAAEEARLQLIARKTGHSGGFFAGLGALSLVGVTLYGGVVTAPFFAALPGWVGLLARGGAAAAAAWDVRGVVKHLKG